MYLACWINYRAQKCLSECSGLIHCVLWKPGGEISCFIKPSITECRLFFQTYKLNTLVVETTVLEQLSSNIIRGSVLFVQHLLNVVSGLQCSFNPKNKKIKV